MKVIILLGKVLLVFVGGVIVLGVGAYFVANRCPR